VSTVVPAVVSAAAPLLDLAPHYRRRHDRQPPQQLLHRLFLLNVA
jgi:hypothetical protein